MLLIVNTTASSNESPALVRLASNRPRVSAKGSRGFIVITRSTSTSITAADKVTESY